MSTISYENSADDTKQMPDSRSITGARYCNLNALFRANISMTHHISRTIIFR